MNYIILKLVVRFWNILCNNNNHHDLTTKGMVCTIMCVKNTLHKVDITKRVTELIFNSIVLQCHGYIHFLFLLNYCLTVWRNDILRMYT